MSHLDRNVIIHGRQKFSGDWIAVPRADFDKAKVALAQLDELNLLVWGTSTVLISSTSRLLNSVGESLSLRHNTILKGGTK